MNPVTEQNAVEVAKTVKGGAVVGPSTARRSPSIAALAAALVKAQGEMANVARNAENPHRNSRYADLAGVRDAVFPVLSRNGLAVLQLPCELDSEAALTTLLLHGSSGEWVETTIRLRPAKPDPQSVGSALTYARRYALMAVAGVAAAGEDDDGDAGSRHQQPTRQPTHPQPTAAECDAERDRLVAAFKSCPDRHTWKKLCDEVVSSHRRGLLPQSHQPAVKAEVNAANTRLPQDPQQPAPVGK